MKQLFLTLLAILILNYTYGQVKATSSEINTGTDDDKFATPFGLQGSKYLDQSGAKLSAVTAAGANTYTATLAPAITSYSSGQLFYIKITTANTGASTLNLNGLGAKALVKDVSSSLVVGDLLANKVYAVYYDGTNFQVMNAASMQTLSTSTTLAGNISISSGNTISLRSISPASSVTFPDANVATVDPGFYPYITGAGSTNYPLNSGGSGFKMYRTANSAYGSLEIYQPLGTTYPYMRFGTNTATFSNWEKIATQEWATTNFVGLGSTKGSTMLTENVDANNVLLTNKTWLSSTATNKPNSDNGFLSTDAVNSTFTSQSFVSGTTDDAFFFRIKSSGVQRPWYQIASRQWAMSNFSPLSGSGSYIQNGTTLQPSSSFNISGRGIIGDRLLLGTSTTSTVNFYNALPITGGTTAFGNYTVTNIQPDVTSVAYGYRTSVGTAASSFTLNQLTHYAASQGTIGTGSTLINQYGFISDSNLIGGTNNYGFYSAIPMGIGRYGFYGAGTAQNYLLGDLGLNVLVPTEKLDVAGNVKITNAIAPKLKLQQSAISQANYIQFLNETASQTGYIGHGATANTNMMVSSSTGNVQLMANGASVGVFSPTGLAVTGTVAATGGNSTNWNTAFSWGNHAGLYSTPAATQTAISTLDANVVHKTGNETITGTKLFSTSVGIGTTNVHSYKLAVGGSMIAESVKVKLQANWPDYVFEKNYPMLPLNELEQFVLKNKHLPDVPTAAEVRKDGIELGEMNARLLQKIEELTLYIIDQQKRIEKLEAKINTPGTK